MKGEGQNSDRNLFVAWKNLKINQLVLSVHDDHSHINRNPGLPAINFENSSIKKTSQYAPHSSLSEQNSGLLDPFCISTLHTNEERP